MFVLFEKSHRNGGTKVRYLEEGPFGPVILIEDLLMIKCVGVR